LIEPAYNIMAKYVAQMKSAVKSTQLITSEKGNYPKSASLWIQSLQRPNLKVLVGKLKLGLRKSRSYASIGCNGVSLLCTPMIYSIAING